MGIKSKRLIQAILLLGSCCAVVLIIQLLLPDDQDSTTQLDDLLISKAKEIKAFQKKNDHIKLALDANNTQISWIASKTIAGKEMNVTGGWNGKFGSNLSGYIVVSPDLNIQYSTVTIEFASLWTEHEILTRVLVKDGFFRTTDHPNATFVSTSIEPIGSDLPKLQGATHRITGNFDLNGITRSVIFPADIEKHGDTLSLQAAFNLNRESFDVVLTNPPPGIMLGDDAINDKVAIILDIMLPLVSPLDLAEKTSLEEDGSVQIRDSSGINKITTAHQLIADKPEIDARQKVKNMAEQLPGAFIETIPFSQIDFEMVLIPGDPDKKLSDFYMGSCEVTWDEFMPWALQLDVESEIEKGENRILKLRPSQPWGQVTRGYGEHGFPALSMSRLAAIKYCRWLSEQTGKSYRLPSENEWDHAYEEGGYRLDTSLTEDQANAIAVFYENCFNEEILNDATRSVGTRQANSLGLYDMAGNVCEWVISDGSIHVARGGHFLSDRTELGVGRHIEDSDKWNMNYPNEPKSIWWFVDAKWLGFRVVCNAASVENEIREAQK